MITEILTVQRAAHIWSPGNSFSQQDSTIDLLSLLQILCIKKYVIEKCHFKEAKKKK